MIPQREDDVVSDIMSTLQPGAVLDQNVFLENNAQPEHSDCET